MRRPTNPAASESDGIAVAPDGTILVTYAAVPNPPTASCSTLDVFAVRSRDRGATWSTPVRISDDPCGSGTSHRDPWISIAPNGRVDAIWNDNRNDPAHGFLYDAYYANSTNDGQTFGRNVRLTNRSFDATHLFIARSSGFQTNEYDTFNGVASTDNGLVGAWADARNDTGNTGLSDVFATSVGFMPPRCTAHASSTQNLDRTRALASTVSCDQAVRVSEPGTVVVSGPLARRRRRGHARQGQSNTYRLSTVTLALAAGRSTMVRVRLSRRLVEIIDSALRQHRRVTVTLTATATMRPVSARPSRCASAD